MFPAENVLLSEIDEGYNSKASNDLNHLQHMYQQNMAEYNLNIII